MNRTIRAAAAVVVLGLASSTVGMAAQAAGLAEAPRGEDAHDVAKWTPVVARSYANQYADVHCVRLPIEGAEAGPYDLGAAPSGTWFFAVATVEDRQVQYGPAELVGTGVPTGGAASDLIGCHGTPRSGPVAVTAPATATSPTPSTTATPAASPTTDASPTTAATSDPVPDQVSSGLGGASGGMAAIGVGALLVLGLAGLGLRARRTNGPGGR